MVPEQEIYSVSIRGELTELLGWGWGLLKWLLSTLVKITGGRYGEEALSQSN